MKYITHRILDKDVSTRNSSRSHYNNMNMLSTTRNSDNGNMNNKAIISIKPNNKKGRVGGLVSLLLGLVALLLVGVYSHIESGRNMLGLEKIRADADVEIARHNKEEAQFNYEKVQAEMKEIELELEHLKLKTEAEIKVKELELERMKMEADEEAKAKEDAKAEEDSNKEEEEKATSWFRTLSGGAVACYENSLCSFVVDAGMNYIVPTEMQGLARGTKHAAKGVASIVNNVYNYAAPNNVKDDEVVIEVEVDELDKVRDAFNYWKSKKKN